MCHPGGKKDGKHEVACADMKKAKKLCRLFISHCKMELFVRKKCFIWDSNPGRRHHNSSALTVPL